MKSVEPVTAESLDYQVAWTLEDIWEVFYTLIMPPLPPNFGGKQDQINLKVPHSRIPLRLTSNGTDVPSS